MTLKQPYLLTATWILAVLALWGCERDTSGLRPVPADNDPVVFGDTFGKNVDFQAFLGSKLDAVQIDGSEKYQGTASLRITVPAPGTDAGTFAGGAFTATYARDLSDYDAVTFWAKANKSLTLDVAGLGNDNTGTSRYEASRSGIPLTTNWTKVVVPIPLPGKLADERGLFFFAEGTEQNTGSTLWFDEIRFEKTGLITNPRPAIVPKVVGAFVGATVQVTGTKTVFDVEGTDVTVDHSPNYFTYASSNDTVAAVVNGEVHAVGTGSAMITGKLGQVDATGALTINVTGAPTTPAPTPTVPAVDVISLFSDAYNDVPVDTWSANWDQADVSDFSIAGNATKAYTNLIYAGIEFATTTIDASDMAYLHLDVWLPSGNLVKVKLVDFGANGVYAGGDDKEQELTFNAASTPPLAIGVWSGLDIPLSKYTLLTSRAHLAQLILSSDSKTVYVDNVYFHR